MMSTDVLKLGVYIYIVEAVHIGMMQSDATPLTVRGKKEAESSFAITYCFGTAGWPVLRAIRKGRGTGKTHYM